MKFSFGKMELEPALFIFAALILFEVAALSLSYSGLNGKKGAPPFFFPRTLASEFVTMPNGGDSYVFGFGSSGLLTAFGGKHRSIKSMARCLPSPSAA